ncbi:hypothetical protein Tco_0098155 [Tanacetum coccineum]
MRLFASRGGPYTIYTPSSFSSHTHLILKNQFWPCILFRYRQGAYLSMLFISFLILDFRGMSSSKPDEMASESSKAVVFPKFDMHIYTFELSSSELRNAVEDYSISLDLHPHLPPFGYDDEPTPIVIRCMSLNINPTVPLFRVFYKLCKQGHWFSFENKTGGRAKKCFKEVTLSLKGWKKKIFLLDRRAVSDAIPWRHGDTDLHDEFPVSYDDRDVAHLSKFLVPLWPPPRHLLYVCGLTTACLHLELRYDIKDQDKNVIDMDTFLKLPSWTRTIVSRGDSIPEDHLAKPNPKIVVAREKKEQQSLAKAEAKRAGAGGSDEILSVTPLHQAALEVTKNPTPVVDVTQDTSYVKKEVVNLSASDAHSSQSSHQGHEDELVNNPYVPNWELCNNLLVCTFRDCRELVSHRDTPTKDEFLGNLSNVEVEKIRRLEKDLEPKTQLLKVAEEKIKGLECEKLSLLDEPMLYCRVVRGLSLGKIEDQIAQFLSEAKDLDIEGLKFELLKVSSDVPSYVDGETASSACTYLFPCILKHLLIFPFDVAIYSDDTSAIFAGHMSHSDSHFISRLGITQEPSLEALL